MPRIALLVLLTSSVGCSTTGTPSPDVGPIDSTAITGTLGSLGAAAPTVSSLMISNSGETLIYLSSAPLTCDQLKVSRWLGGATAGSQVVEVIVEGAPRLEIYAVPPAEVNFAEGGRSSATETGASSGSVAFTRYESNALAEGTFHAKYGSNMVDGVFHATFCAGGQGY